MFSGGGIKLSYFDRLKSGQFVSESNPKITGTIKVYRDRLVNLNSKNRSLVLKKLYNKRAFDITNVFQTDPYEIRSFLLSRNSGSILISNSIDRKLKEEDIEKAISIEKNLFQLKSEIEMVEKERGSNDLYVGYPFVEGTFKDSTFLRAPLFLFPVSVIKEDYRWYLVNRAEDDVMVNRTFALANEKYNEVKINEELLDFDEFDANEFLKWGVNYYKELNIEISCKNFSMDKILNPLIKFENYTKSTMPQIKSGDMYLVNSIVLGQFPVGGSAIYEDYKELIKENAYGKQVIGLLGDSETEESAEEEVVVNEKNLNLISDMDYSQEKAVVRSSKDSNLVIYGPPGTGKSQVIVNIIANSLAKGDKVLMVSQKKAALDVVYTRLSNLGFGDFIGYVHDYNQDRKTVYNKIINMIDNSVYFDFNIRQYNELSRKIDDNINKLDKIADSLNLEREFGLTLRELLANSKSKLDVYSELFAERFSLFENLNNEELKDMIKTLENNKAYLKFDFKSNPVKNRTDYSKLQNLDRQRIITIINELKDGIIGFDSKMGFLEILNLIIHELPSFEEMLKDHFASKFTEAKNDFINGLTNNLNRYQKNADSSLLAIWDKLKLKINEEVQNIDNLLAQVTEALDKFQQYNILISEEKAANISELMNNSKIYSEGKWYSLDKYKAKKFLKKEFAGEKLDNIIKLIASTNGFLEIYNDLNKKIPKLGIKYEQNFQVFLGKLNKEKASLEVLKNKLKSIVGLEYQITDIKYGNDKLFNKLELTDISNYSKQFAGIVYEIQSNKYCNIVKDLEAYKTSLDNYCDNCFITINTIKANNYVRDNVVEDKASDVFNHLEVVEAFEKYDKFDINQSETAISNIKNIINKSADNKELLKELRAKVPILWSFSEDIHNKVINKKLLEEGVKLHEEFLSFLIKVGESIDSQQLKGFIQEITLNFKKFDSSLKQYINAAEVVLDAADKLAKYFKPKYIYNLKIKVLKGTEVIAELEASRDQISNEFDDIVLFDYNKNSFTSYEKNLIKILEEEVGEDQERIDNYSEVIRNTVYLVWIEEIRNKDSEVLTLIGKEDEIRNDTYKMMGIKKKAARDFIRKGVYDKVNELPYKIGKTNLRRLKAEASKKRKLLPLRRFIKQFYNEGVEDILPCWLVTPEVASAIFPLKENLFDIVIFDEASQMYVENAIPIIYRTKRVVVAGDDKQLQPSDLYTVKLDVDSLEDEDEEDEYVDNLSLEEKSLIDLTKHKYNSTALNYHYRSNYEQLIAFSNNAFYEGNVQIVPNISKEEIPPIERVKVDGLWIDKKNSEEAKYIVKLVKHILLNRKNNETIGIITFNSTQQDHITELLDKECIIDSQFSQLYLKETNNKENEDRNIFVKNIENVQGDERDIIIFSIGYGKDEKGKIRANFGLLNREGGENRLNVAISRARQKVVVVTSIEPEELSVEGSKNRGPILLKEYLKYARTVTQGDNEGATAILEGLLDKDNVSRPRQQEDSINIFEEELYDSLVKLGYIVHRNIGVSNYKLDMAIFDKELEQYILGIECDGRMYSLAESARERDIYRQKFFETRGWSLYRAWSYNWWKDSKKEIENINSLVRKNKESLQGNKALEKLTILPYHSKLKEQEAKESLTNINKTQVSEAVQSYESSAPNNTMQKEDVKSNKDKPKELKDIIVEAIMNHSIIKKRKEYRFRYENLKQYVEEQTGKKILDLDFIRTIEKSLSNILFYDKARDVFITIYDNEDEVAVNSSDGGELNYTDKIFVKKQKGQELSDWEEQWLIDTRNSRVRRS